MKGLIWKEIHEQNSAHCPLTTSVQQFEIELGLLGVEPYYMIYQLDPDTD